MFKPEGIVQFFRNDSVINQYKFVIIKDTSHSQTINLLHIEGTESFRDQLINFQGSDSLVLSDNGTDAFYHFYIRLK